LQSLSRLEPRDNDLECTPTTEIALRIATFYVIGILIHAATLHSAPGQGRKILFARGVGMIFSPVTAGLYSLMTLGRIGMASISTIAKKMEVLARLSAPVEAIRRLSHSNTQRRHTVAWPSNPHALSSSSAGEKIEPDEEPHDRRGSDPGPSRPPPTVTRATSASDSSSSPVDQLHKSPIQSSLSLAATAALKPKRLKQHKAIHTEIDLDKELPQSLQTNAVRAGAVAIHVPKRFKYVLRARNWEELPPKSFREVSTEYCREPSSDPVFEKFSQFVLPPTALLLDPTFRVYPESMFREAAAGLLQLGFGLYQLVSDDAKMSVQKDGLASPYLLVLPYLLMAAVNILVNVMDPPYSVVTVLNICKEARKELINPDEDDESALPTISSRSGVPSREPSTSSLSRKTSDLRLDTSVIWEHEPSQFSTLEPATAFLSEGYGTWSELTDWIAYAYGDRLDICPVDRLYQTPWLSHAIVIAEFVWNAFSALLVPALVLLTVGAWTHFKTSTYGYSLAFNILVLFGFPFIQFVLCTCHLLSRLHRDMKGRKEYGTSYWKASAQLHHDDEKRRTWWRWMTGRIKDRSRWWDLIAKSLGIYFPVRKTIISIYVFVIVGVATTEFILVGFNLMRTLNCEMDLLM
jgi:hypothetical protein